MIKRILIPVDFSADSARAAQWGLELGTQLAGEVLLVTVLDVGDLRVAMNAGLHGFQDSEDVRRQVQEWVEAEYAKIAPPGTKNVRRDVRRGVVEREIAEAIEQYEADLVVIGATGIGNKTGLGSKADYFLRKCNVPVVVVRRHDA
jgi:nucleotide-binding universal stress UspA family protein